MRRFQKPHFVIPVETGIQEPLEADFVPLLDSRFRGKDGKCQHNLVIATITYL